MTYTTSAMEATVRFDSTASSPRHGLALVYDLEGFSKFFNQPDVQDYVPQFINTVSAAVSVTLFGGDAYWLGDENKMYKPLSIRPLHEKFLGDGALYVWLDTPDKKITTPVIANLCNRLWTLKTNFSKVVAASFDDVPVVDVPRRIRFGLARGTIFELTRRSEQEKEYIGFCLNLASRLQKYCPDLGFIASARLRLPAQKLTQYGYTRVVATEIKGFPREIVVVDSDEYDHLDTHVRDALFEPLEDR